jgi:hypothetical protein
VDYSIFEDFGRILHRKNLFVIKDNGVRGERGRGERRGTYDRIRHVEYS